MAASPIKPKSGVTTDDAPSTAALPAFKHLDDDTGQGIDVLKKSLPAPLVFVPAASPSVASKPSSSSSSSSLSFAAQHALATSSSLPGASYALTVMTLLNLLNYCDRFVPSACKGLIQADLGLSDVQTALPMGAFLLVYMLTSPVFGYLADQGHVRRTSLIGAGVFLWSLATTAGAFATDFTSFLLARAAVGVGEAAYATIAPALLCDFFPVHMRPKILSFFYLAMPVGAALGYAVAGEVGEAHGWRTSFLVCGIPGMVLVVLVLGMTEPPRGQQDAAAVEQALAAGHAAPVVAPSSSAAVAGADANAVAGAPSGSSGAAEAGEASEDADVGWPEALQSLLGNAHYMAALGAVTLVSFASGGIADWLPTWLVRVQGIDVGTAGTLVGAITCVAGVGGSLSGYVIGESLAARGVSNAYFVVGAVSQGVTCLFSAGLLLAGKYASLPETALLIFVCQFCMWLNVGGCSAVIANSVHVKIRSRAFGLSILISHLGGDAISPSLIGAISDESGGNLSMGFSVVPVAFGLAAVVFAIAARRLHDPHAEAIRLLPPPVGSARGGGKGLSSSSSSSDDIELTLAESPRSASASAAATANDAAAEDEFESIEPDLLEAEV
jgi:MFS family permease